MKGYNGKAGLTAHGKSSHGRQDAGNGSRKGASTLDPYTETSGKSASCPGKAAKGLSKGGNSGFGTSSSSSMSSNLCLEALRSFAIQDDDGCVCPLVDIGANFSKFTRQEIDRQLRRAAAAGVEEIICTGTSVKGSMASLQICNSPPSFEGAPRLFFTAGIHPHDAKEFGPGTVDQLRKLAADKTCVAIGECGLDYDRMHSTREVQLACFRAQLDLAKELCMPLFCHERDLDPRKGPPLGSATDFMRLLQESGVDPATVCVHCFTGEEKALGGYVRAGCAIGVTGFVGMHRRGAHLRAQLAQGSLPLGQLMIETDAPFMMPDRSYIPIEIGMQERTMEPCAMPAVCRAVAECYGCQASHVATMTTRHARTFFRLDGSGVDSRPGRIYKAISEHGPQHNDAEESELSTGMRLEPNQQKKTRWQARNRKAS